MPGEGRREEIPFLQRAHVYGMAPDFVHGLMKEMPAPEGGPRGSSALGDPAEITSTRKLMETVDVTGPATKGTKIWAFIGPTGVGKTTTTGQNWQPNFT